MRDQQEMRCEREDLREILDRGACYLGIELGSTRIKGVLIDTKHRPLASGSYDWENQLQDGYWTYPLDQVEQGLQTCFARLNEEVRRLCGRPIRRLAGMGVSAMMHGYLAFDAEDRLLTPFRTWRNTNAKEASERLTERFQYNIPERWSIAHLYQAVLEHEPHVAEIAWIATLASYVHYRLTGLHVLGVGDASGMFPIATDEHAYRPDLLASFDELVHAERYSWRISDILPALRYAGEDSGTLTEQGARFLDPSGTLEAGIPLCAPEGDAGTGMVATNSVRELGGNVSAGTSIFAMIVLPHQLSRLYRAIDPVTTPSGKPVAMVHANNCTSDLDAWIRLFADALKRLGLDVPKARLYDAFYQAALEGEADGGGILTYNYLSGEFIADLKEGRPLLVRMPDAKMDLANFARVLIFSTMATLRMGMTILDREGIRLKRLLGHGGLFKTPRVGQRLMAAALNVPVAVMASAAEGGAWGIACLAAYRVAKEEGESLEDYLDQKVFADAEASVEEPRPNDVKGFAAFMERYQKGLSVEREAVRALDC